MIDCTMELSQPDVGGEVCENEASSALHLAGIRRLLTEVLAIRVPSLKEYVSAFRAALVLSWEMACAWTSVVTLILSPVFQLLALLGRAVWPHLQRAAVSAWRFQTSLPRSTLLIEAATLTFLVLVFMLRRLIIRRRYIPRAQQSVRSLRARIDRRYVAFTAAVERKVRISARAFPHVVYWSAAIALVIFAPTQSAVVSDKFWVGATVTWPALYALYLVLLLRSESGLAGPGHDPASPRQPGATAGHAAAISRMPLRRSLRLAGVLPGEAVPVPRGALVTAEDVDRVLMYWVVFSVARCCSIVANLVPLVAPLLESLALPTVRTLAFLAVVWMHLPGPGSGLQVVYASLEPLIHTYVKDLRAARDYRGGLQRIQDVLVFLRVMTKEHAQVLADNVADSWMLLPAPMFLFSPTFMAQLACVYAGLVVPGLNSIKALGRRTGARTNGRRAPQLLTGPDGGARVRWLNYWVVYAGWWHACYGLGGLLNIVPFATHAQLLLYLWLQVPVFRGALRILDYGDRCLTRWGSPNAAVPSAVLAGRESSGYESS